MRNVCLLFSLGCVLTVSAAAAEAMEVRLQVQESAQVGRSPAVITTGVPFARGAVRDVRKLAVSVGGRPVPAQFIRTVPWEDGSVRWALMDVQVDVPAGGKVELLVSDSGANPAPAQPVTVEDGAEAVRVSTGPLQFVVNKRKFNLFESITVDGKEQVTSAGRGLVVLKEDGQAVAAGPPSDVKVEQAGPLRTIICVKGKFPGVHKDLLGYTARISAFAGRKHVKVHVWLENRGGMGYFTPKDFNRRAQESPRNFDWLLLKGMAVELGLGLGGSVTARCEDAEGTGRLKVLQTCLHSRTKKKNTSQGPFYTWKDLEYTITSGEKELKRGHLTDGVVALKGERGALTAAIRDFWQNYEKAVELDGTTLRLWLWPTEGQWPRPFYWLYYAIDKIVDSARKDGLYLLQGGVHKGHEFILDFSGRDAKESLAELSAPLWALASAEYYAATEAAPGLFAPPAVRTADADCNAKLDAWMRMTRSMADRENPAGLWRARQVSDFFQSYGHPGSSYWFGWMDYGDLSVPGHGHVGLHYDWPWITLLGAMRTGDAGFLGLATAMTRHRIDVDQLWSDRDLPRFRGLQRGGGSWTSYHCARLYAPPSASRNWIAGVVLYYMLTGEPKALECCRRNAEGLKTAWGWIHKTKPWAGPQGDMAANAWSMSSYCAMYKLTGDGKWLDEALSLFKKNVVPKWKDLGPLLHDPARQIRSQDYIQEDVKYCYSIASFCELHHLTGDEELFTMLKEGCEQEFPESFFDAPLFVADLYAYVGLKTGKAEYLTRAADSFATAFPESRCPPVFLPGNSTWSRTSAMMLRTGHLLQYANWKMGRTRLSPGTRGQGRTRSRTGRNEGSSPESEPGLGW